MATIKIYQQEYTLPVLANDRFQRLQQAIRERQHVIKESKRAVVREYWEEQPETSAPPEPLNWLRKWLPKPKSDPPPKRVPRTVTTYQPLTIEGHFQETRQLV